MTETKTETQSDSLKTAINWVPQIFYDLIARIIPGFVILSGSIVIVLADERSKDALLSFPAITSSWVGATTAIFAAISISYAIGVLLSGLRYLIFGVCFVIPPFRNKGFDRETGIRNEKEEFWDKYDFIKKEFPPAGNRITKLKAEVHMSHVLCAGAPILMLIALDIKTELFWFPYFRWALLVGWLGSIGAIWHFIGRITSAVTNYAERLGYKPIKKRTEQIDAANVG